MCLTREAKLVLDVLRRHHVQVGERMRYDALYNELRDARHARRGTAELERLGLIEPQGEEAELTALGYNALWSVN